MRIKSYDILTMTLDSETKKLGSDYRELEFNKKYLEKICELIDLFIESEDMDSIEVDVEEDTLNIIISVIGMYFEYVGVANLFMEIASKATEVRFETCDEDHFKTMFVFNGIWEK